MNERIRELEKQSYITYMAQDTVDTLARAIERAHGIE